MYARSQWIQLIGAFILFASGTAFSAIKSGQLTIINSLANGISTGTTASGVSIQVSDQTGPCTTTRTLIFNGSAIIKWDSTKVHTATQCTGIVSVAVTPLRAIIGTVSTLIYDSTTSTPVPASTATSAVHYFAPTVAAANSVLLITGAGVPASTQSVSATSWGIGAAYAPVFNPANGALLTVGVPGGEGMIGLKAERVARRYGVSPHR